MIDFSLLFKDTLRAKRLNDLLLNELNSKSDEENISLIKITLDIDNVCINIDSKVREVYIK